MADFISLFGGTGLAFLGSYLADKLWSCLEKKKNTI